MAVLFGGSPSISAPAAVETTPAVTIPWEQTEEGKAQLAEDERKARIEDAKKTELARLKAAQGRSGAMRTGATGILGDASVGKSVLTGSLKKTLG
ncbi:MAG: hypothetical protein AB7E47_02355 [Desulfovibrionaceae bacterium]